jgi:hypothetical protein
MAINTLMGKYCLLHFLLHKFVLHETAVRYFVTFVAQYNRKYL